MPTPDEARARLADALLGADPVLVVPGWTRVLSHLAPGRAIAEGKS